MTTVDLGQHMHEELASQPETWERAAAQTADFALLPDAGERVAVVGCGTSWFMAQSYAALREAAGAGLTDAFPASGAPLQSREYDSVVAITRSGTTTEVRELLAGLDGRTRRVAIIGDPESGIEDVADAVIALPYADERSVVQTRFATTVVALLRAALGHDLTGAIADARAAVEDDLDGELVDADQYTFVGSDWSVGLAHEGALKLRESSQTWTESYPEMEYRHGPISIAAPGRVVWSLSGSTGLADDVRLTGARFEVGDLDPLAELVRVQRVALARARRRGLDADRPRNLTRAVILESRR